ncbi:MAG: SH3 domain-containing protein [Thiohalobacterales bacterium]
MRSLILILTLLTGALPALTHAADNYFQAQVAEPYLELHTGAGRGYPVFHVVDRGETIEVIMRRTDWFLVRTQKGTEGWVSRDAMTRTLTLTGLPTLFAEPDIGDFSRRRWEAGLIGGRFSGEDTATAYGAYAFTPHLFGEISVSQIFGDFSDSYMGLISLVAQPFPKWRLSPYFVVGTGLIYTDPKSTLVDENDDDRTDQVGSAGAGVRLYLTRRFILRAEYRRNTIFQDKDDNQELNAWQAGIGFFF